MRYLGVTSLPVLQNVLRDGGRIAFDASALINIVVCQGFATHKFHIMRSGSTFQTQSTPLRNFGAFGLAEGRPILPKHGDPGLIQVIVHHLAVRPDQSAGLSTYD
jgi:hypothetical protein